MRVSVFGLGYVGAVTAACLATDNDAVIGVDIKDAKVNSINNGKAPFFENGLNELISQEVDKGHLWATTDCQEAIENSDISLVCVGTPNNYNGGLNLDHILRVSDSIGCTLKNFDKYHTIVVRSTMLPGTTENAIIPLIEDLSGKSNLKDFGVCVNPEFLREGQAIDDFYHPERIVFGGMDTKSFNDLSEIYKGVVAPIVKVDIRTAEMVKYIDNSFHAIKISFANEVGSICKRLNIDSQEIMQIFCMDKKLNLAPYYLRPGFGFGGSCLPKDLEALLIQARELKLNCRLLESAVNSNQEHISRAVELIISQRKKKIGILGLSFKGGTSDTRESPAIYLINKLYEKVYVNLFDKGYDISIYDPNYHEMDMENVPPYIAPLIRPSLEDVIETSDLLVLTNNDQSFNNLIILMKAGQILIDCVNMVKDNHRDDISIIKLC